MVILNKESRGVFMFRKSIINFFKNPLLALPNIILGLIAAIITQLVSKNSYFNKLALQSNSTSYADFTPEMAKSLSYILLIIIFLFFISPFITSWINIMCKNVVNDEKPAVFESLKKSPQFYWRIMGVFAIKFLIFTGISIIFFIAMLPSIISMAAHPETLSTTFVILVIVLIIAIITLIVALMPIETLLIYDNLKIGDALSKGLKFGFKHFFKILGVEILIAAITYITSKLLINFEIVETLLTSYLNLFITVYIMNLFRNTKKEPKLIIEHSVTETNNTIEQEEKNIKDNNDDNTFIV